MAAACSARECGLEVVVLDDQTTPGGQLFRHIESPLAQTKIDSKEYQQGLELINSFRGSGAWYYPKTIVWGIESHQVSCTVDGTPTIFQSLSIIIAPGAMERPVPFPGWTIPGVLGAGGAEIILRGNGTVTRNAEDPVVLAGNGPLLLLLANHLLDSGAKIAAWLDTGSWSKRIRSLPRMFSALGDFPYLSKGMGMALKIVKNKIPIVSGIKNIEAVGEEHIKAVLYEAKGKKHEIKSSCLIRHEGIIPRIHIPNALEVELQWDQEQRYWYPITNQFGATSKDGIYLIGDAGHVDGGDASQLKGYLAGVDVARYLGIISLGEAAYRSKKVLQELKAIQRARSFLRYIFAPNPNIFQIPDKTIVCRCEMVTAEEIRKAVKEGATNVNEVKLYTRCGMGPCQGRMCGPALAEITAGELSRSPSSVGTLQVRHPFRPVSLENYCKLHSAE